MGEDSVSLLNACTLRRSGAPVGRFPNELAYASDGRLFVANGGSNSVSVIRGDRVIETLEVSLRAGSKVGSTTNAIAVNPEGTLLFAANAGNNSVAVVDISDPEQSALLGFILTAWYPSALAISPDGRTLYIGIGKGAKSVRTPYATPPPRLGERPKTC
jgi:DNA-binding beta-propeller fold protein YncE